MSRALRGRLATFTRLSCLLRDRLTEQSVEVHRRNHQRREPTFNYQIVDRLASVGEQNSWCDGRE